MRESLLSMSSPELIDDVEKPKDECGVFGVYAPGQPVAAMTIEGLSMLQGRGQSAAGLFVYREDGMPYGTKDVGLVPAALRAALPPTPDAPSPFDTHSSAIGIGHVRYSTSGKDKIDGAHPFASSATGLVFATNGHTSGLGSLKLEYGVSSLEPTTDSQDGFAILDAAYALYGNVEKAMHEVLPRFQGSYCTLVSDGQNLYAARDPRAYHPLCIGELPDRGYVVASESVALFAIGATFMRDVEPGEIITIGPEGISSTFMSRAEDRRACLYEYAYTAHPASDLDGSNVYQSRVLTGKYLAEDFPVEADIVIAAPESGRGVAEGFAERSGIPLKQGIIKNGNVQRTFIERGKKREDAISRKYIPIRSILEGKRVVVGDDSLIKGNTMRKLIKVLRAAGALEVHVRLGAPYYLHPCYMGMDTGDPNELVARGKTDAEIAAHIGADSVAYSTVARSQQAIVEAGAYGDANKGLRIGQFCTACATGEYPPEIAQAINLGMPRLRVGATA